MQPSTSPAKARPRKFDSSPALVAVTLSATLLFFVPAHAYLVNQSSVMVFFDDMLFITAALMGVVGLLLTALMLAVPHRFRAHAVTLLFAVTLLCWFHSYLLVWSYDVLDGATIPWEEYSGRLLIDTGLWLLVCVSFLRFAPRLHPRLPLLCAGLLLIQGGSLGVHAWRTFSESRDLSKHYYVDKGPVFQFSPERNVIIILLDEYQTDVFSEAILPQDHYRRSFEGFTYFPDTISGFNFTEFAIPAILTGRIYDNSQRRADFLQAAYLGDSLPGTLMREGYDVHLYPWRSLANEAIYYHDGLATNVLRRPRPLGDKLVDVARLIDLGLFRSMPQFAKRRIYNDSQWLLSHALAGVSAAHSEKSADRPASGSREPREFGIGLTLDDTFRMFALGLDHPDIRITTRPGKGVFKFYHLAGLHVPVKMKRDLSYGNFEYNRVNFSEQAEAYARIMGAFFEQLKRHDLYDNSLIILVGDHGSGRAKDMYVRPEFTERTVQLDQTAARGDFQRDKARGLPLLLIKRIGAKGGIVTSTTPASAVDIPATVLSELHLKPKAVPAISGKPEFQGIPLFETPEVAANRTRYYGAMLWTPQQSDYLGSLGLYRIQGHGWSDSSWSFVQKLTPPAQR